MSQFTGVNDGDVATVSGGPVTGEGQKLTFTLHGGVSLVRAPFSVRTKRYDTQGHAIAVVTLQGHPLRGYRFWKVFSPDNVPGHYVLQTGALDQPGPGFADDFGSWVDQLAYLVGESKQLGIWQEYLEDAVQKSGGHEGYDPSYDFPFGLYGFPSKNEVLDEVSGIHP